LAASGDRAFLAALCERDQAAANCRLLLDAVGVDLACRAAETMARRGVEREDGVAVLLGLAAQLAIADLVLERERLGEFG